MTTTPDTETTADARDNYVLRFLMEDLGQPSAGRLETEFRAHRIVATERGNQIVTTLNGAHVYTYQDMDTREATARVMDAIRTVDHVRTPDSHEDHWYARGRDDYAAQYYRWFPKHQRAPRPAPPAELPDVGDLVDYSDDGETPEAEGPAVVLTVANLGHGVWSWDLHTRGGVLRSVKNADCMRLIRHARMTDDEAAWIRANIWTQRMRKSYKDTPDYYHSCACQYGPTGHCQHGRHGECQFTAMTPKHVSCEAYITSRDGYVMSFDEPFENGRQHSEAQVWLADRACAWKCSCDCHTAMAAPIVTLPPIRVGKSVKGDQLDLFAAFA